MTKRTPLQEYRAALEKWHAAREKAREQFESKKLDVIERVLDDRELIKRIETDPGLSPEERLTIFKRLRGWARIVFGLYETERKAVSAADVGKPSDIAYEKVGRVVRLGPDRIKTLCNEGRRQLKEGMSSGLVVEMTAAEFERRLLRRNRTSRRKGRA
jgi:hypothetical protein